MQKIIFIYRFQNWIQDDLVHCLEIKVLDINILQKMKNNYMNFPLIFSENQITQLEMEVDENLYKPNNLNFVCASISNIAIDVIDVVKQDIIKVRMKDYVNWFKKNKPEQREEIYNVLSFEFSSEYILNNAFKRPGIVRQLEWKYLQLLDVNNLRYYQKYFILSCANSYTMWHIDFTGTSVYYHILQGTKWFFIIEPTDIHLRFYFEWRTLNLSTTMWLPEYIRRRYISLGLDVAAFDVYMIELVSKQTLLLGAGWIHCVYTTEDTTVIGGNYLNSHFIELQMKVHLIDELLESELKYKTNYFPDINVVILNQYLAELGMYYLCIIFISVQLFNYSRCTILKTETKDLTLITISMANKLSSLMYSIYEWYRFQNINKNIFQMNHDWENIFKKFDILVSRNKMINNICNTKYSKLIDNIKTTINSHTNQPKEDSDIHMNLEMNKLNTQQIDESKEAIDVNINLNECSTQEIDLLLTLFKFMENKIMYPQEYEMQESNYISALQKDLETSLHNDV